MNQRLDCTARSKKKALMPPMLDEHAPLFASFPIKALFRFRSIRICPGVRCTLHMNSMEVVYIGKRFLERTKNVLDSPGRPSLFVSRSTPPYSLAAMSLQPLKDASTA